MRDRRLYNMTNEPVCWLHKGTSYRAAPGIGNEPGFVDVSIKCAEYALAKFPEQLSLDQSTAAAGIGVYMPIFSKEHKEYIENLDDKGLEMLLGFLSVGKEDPKKVPVKEMCVAYLTSARAVEELKLDLFKKEEEAKRDAEKKREGGKVSEDNEPVIYESGKPINPKPKKSRKPKKEAKTEEVEVEKGDDSSEEVLGS